MTAHWLLLLWIGTHWVPAGDPLTLPQCLALGHQVETLMHEGKVFTATRWACRRENQRLASNS